MDNKPSDKAGEGYGKPPEDHKWKPGQSGNPAGRKKAEPPHLKVKEYLARALRKLVTVTDKGKKVEISLLELLCQQLVFGAAKGKSKEIALVLQFLTKSGVLGPDEVDEDYEEPIFSEEDRRLIAIAYDQTFRE